VKRGLTGRWSIQQLGGEPVRSFLPAPLPAADQLHIDGNLRSLLDDSLLALGRLDSVSSLLPDTHLFLYAFIRKEALLSSQIEGTQSSLSDLLAYEASAAPGVPLDDVQEVSSYVAALNWGLAELRGGFPLSARLIRGVHERLLATGRGADKMPGEFRRSQNWIGGTRPGNAIDVPPPHTDVAGCMSELERYLHDMPTRTPPLIKAALAHVQLETIHPFLDGNGRVGRLLITMILCAEGVLREPMLYLSLYLKQHRAEYYALLTRVREEGDWEAWLTFFATGVHETATGAVQTAQRLVELFRADRERIQMLGRSAGTTLRIYDALRSKAIDKVGSLSARSGTSEPTTNTGLRQLESLGIAREITGRKRDRAFSYPAYIQILSEGTEPL
jgi:Fic family protein